MSLLNPHSTMKPLSFRLFFAKAEALSEIKILTLLFLCSVLASSAPLFIFLNSSFDYLGSTLDLALSSSCIPLNDFLEQPLPLLLCKLPSFHSGSEQGLTA